MAQITNNCDPLNKNTQLNLFNSPLETGVRLLIILNAVHPQELDLASLIWLDYLVVHTEDIGGPPSLHPDTPQRKGELLIRRNLIKSSLDLIKDLHYIDTIVANTGITYTASEEAPSLIEMLESKYTTELKLRADWLAKNICIRGQEEMKNIIINKIGRWGIEFQNKDDHLDMSK